MEEVVKNVHWTLYKTDEGKYVIASADGEIHIEATKQLLTLSASESSAGTETIGVQASISLEESVVGSDVPNVTAPVSVVDVCSSEEQTQTTVSTAVDDLCGSLEAIDTLVALTVADQLGALEQFATRAELLVSDIGQTLDTIQKWELLPHLPAKVRVKVKVR